MPQAVHTDVSPLWTNSPLVTRVPGAVHKAHSRGRAVLRRHVHCPLEVGRFSVPKDRIGLRRRYVAQGLRQAWLEESGCGVRNLGRNFAGFHRWLCVYVG